MTVPLSMLLVFGLLGMATILWGRARLRRIELGRMPVVFGVMMARLGLSPVDVASAGLEGAMIAAGERCRSCDSGGLCRDWLALSGTPAPHCPNAPLFEAVHVQRRPPAPAERSRLPGLG